jgi:8-oxo-dGTP pyrophosphatase MutT (NUDIX family)
VTELSAFFGDVTERAVGLADGTITAPEPRHAATVVLLRDGATGLEVYLLRRVASMAFAAGFTVFPGGSVDPRDAHVADSAWAGPPPESWARSLSADTDLARSLVCAAVRETFEESGVLLAGSPTDVVDDVSGDDWEADRQALVDRTLAFADLLDRRALVVRSDLLRAWDHWITPEVETRRFDTRFFVAALPAGQLTRHVGGEADRVVWMRPADALDGVRRGELGMLPPTQATLTALSDLGSVADVLDAAARRTIRPTLPKVLVNPPDPADPDAAPTLRFLLPGDDGYPG